MAKVSISQDQLRHCKIESKRLTTNCFPDFLIIGPQRTGTSWLANNLEWHPEVFFSNPKEIFYFNNLGKPENRRHQSDYLEWYLNFFQPSAQQRLKRSVAYFRYYKEFFKIKAVGEGTATYGGMVAPEVIDEILLMNPRIKIILMLRNPVKRAWAHCKKDLSNQSVVNEQYRSIEEIPIKEIKDFVTSGYQIKCGKVSEIHELWLNKVGQDNLLVGVFDDLREDPAGLLLNVMQFIGVRSEEKFLTHRMGRVVNKTDNRNEKRDIPQEIEDLLSDLFADQIQWVNQKAGRELVY